MITFQFDQCLNSKRFARDCQAEHLCETLRLPAALADAKDPDLLRTLMARENPLVTFDRALPRDHAPCIPERNPGIIVLTNFPAPQTMTIRIAQHILKRFKLAFPQWHEVSWMNSIVEITTINVEVWHVDQAKLIRNAYLGFDSADWQTQLQDLLRLNSQGTEPGTTSPARE
jgi:hypothetical protein